MGNLSNSTRVGELMWHMMSSSILLKWCCQVAKYQSICQCGDQIIQSTSLSLRSCWPSLTANLLANVTASRAFPFYVSDTTSTFSPLISSISSHLPIKWLSMLHVSHPKMLPPVAMEISLLRVGGSSILAIHLENMKREQPNWGSK